MRNTHRQAEGIKTMNNCTWNAHKGGCLECYRQPFCETTKDDLHDCFITSTHVNELIEEAEKGYPTYITDGGLFTCNNKACVSKCMHRNPHLPDPSCKVSCMTQGNFHCIPFRGDRDPADNITPNEYQDIYGEIPENEEYIILWSVLERRSGTILLYVNKNCGVTVDREKATVFKTVDEALEYGNNNAIKIHDVIVK